MRTLSILALLVFAVGLQASTEVELAWDPSPDASVVGYNVYYGGGGSGMYTNKVTVGNVTNATVRGLKEGTMYFFAATAFTADNLESEFSLELAWLSYTNTPPKIGGISDIVLRGNSGITTIPLTGISSGNTNESQVVTITASTSNPSVIGIVSVNYTNPSTTGTLTITTRTNASGKATITVFVSDGLSTTTRPFQVSVRPVSGGKPRITKETLFSQIVWPGEPNSLYAIEHSDNLKGWEPWTIVTSDAIGEVSLFELPLSQASYYRMKEFPAKQ